ncbi:MAG: CorA family divalent cation transporter, partial [Woeseiaceae bacterium]|nr:CorA family divalent cation transporter [Woeseiaceae bacterium]
ATRRQIAAVRRFLSPQRDALDRFNRHHISFFDDQDMHALRQETDRITRYLEDLDLMRERTVVLQEELLSQLAQQQNTRMYVLSVVAAVFLPLTFVTGLLGMNVGGLPGVDSAAGFAASVVVMVVLGVALLAFFRWKKWL